MRSQGIMTAIANAEKKSWRTPMLCEVGRLAQIVRRGGGKLTPSPNDPGEPRKPKGGGG